MSEIDNPTFFDQLVVGKYSLFRVTGIPPISFNEVIEFQSGKKFFYKVQESSDLSKSHNSIVSKFLNNIPLNNSAKAFRPQTSYLNFLEPHRKNYNFLRLDIKNFFHSISEDLLKESFDSYFKAQIVNTKTRSLLVDSFINLVTVNLPRDSKNKEFLEKKILPIGFSTSPVISNIIFRKFDILIQMLCSRYNIEYTRYADDLLFSSPKNLNTIQSAFFHNEVCFLLSSGGFKINNSKILSAKKLISIKGYTIDGSEDEKRLGTIRISNKKLKIIEKLLHEKNKGTDNVTIMKKVFKKNIQKIKFKFEPKKSFLEKYCYDQIINKALGYRSFLISLIKFHNLYECIDEDSIKKYNSLIKELEKLTQTISITN
ncbi:reverse transcriptase family protein [Pseudoalteromonas sp. Angola-4]|uniref:reverse transcriptase family protein n=1 Tax=Pseudoalteromonas sp. Angola-4 TaxID=3025335 RepID=UPI002359D7AA|nr:reverse transcriptase family protein [Pseudoalteromonas sp. Angola-4]MDC9509913.1 reverse transcriptase family protein [Pseudoalteromonas sp. Angola-4]